MRENKAERKKLIWMLPENECVGVRRFGASQAGRMATLLFDVVDDPGQTNPLDDPAMEARMILLMLAEMRRNDCPPEQRV